MKIRLRHMAWVGGLAILFGLYSVYAAQGTVIDGSTGKPMAGVHVVASWTGSVSIAVQPFTRCYRAEATVTDERGRFSLSTFSGNWNPILWDRNRSVWVLAPSYTISDKSDFGELKIVLEPAKGTKSEQFKSLPSSYVLGCGVDNRQFLPYLLALHKEMLRLASTRDERRVASSRLFDIEEIELGEREAYRRLNARSRLENLGGGND
ncbi:MAG: carboxypeptidase regulatory-like domain-containing protein [Betaproteobacteria bacterium]|nr:carboxypeptidase regulatory-like domain-containing protein [Betaproteobacteria bacterium]